MIARSVRHVPCKELGMDITALRIPRRYGHFVFGTMQSGLTCLIASAIASLAMASASIGQFLGHWLGSWLVSWAVMLPVVLLAAPAIQALSLAVTRDDPATAD